MDYSDFLVLTEGVPRFIANQIKQNKFKTNNLYVAKKAYAHAMGQSAAMAKGKKTRDALMQAGRIFKRGKTEKGIERSLHKTGESMSKQLKRRTKKAVEAWWAKH